MAICVEDVEAVVVDDNADVGELLAVPRADSAAEIAALLGLAVLS